MTPNAGRHDLCPFILVLLTLAACSSTAIKETVPPRFSVEQVPRVIEVASRQVSSGENLAGALDNLRSARNTPDLPSAQAQEVQNALERAAIAVTSQSLDADLLEKLVDADIPRRLAVEAGMRAARLYFEEGERMQAFRLVRRLASRFPNHQERAAASQLLLEIGLDLARDRSRYGLFFRYRTLAPEVLEFMVLNHPSDPRGALALWTLAELYEEDRQLAIAVHKLQDLLLWFPDCQYATASQARIPHLRLLGSGSPEFDRNELVLAERELQQWLGEHRDPELEKGVRLDLLDVRGRLADNSMVVARFYQTLREFEGAHLHARRALGEARSGGDSAQILEAETLLASIASWGAGGDE